MWPLLLLLPLFGFVGAGVAKRLQSNTRIPDSLGQTQAFVIPSATDGSVNAADLVLNQPTRQPNGTAPTLPEWYDIMRGAVDDFGYSDMFVGPASTPGGKLRDDVLPPNYVKPINQAPVNSPVSKPSATTPSATAPRVTTQPASNPAPTQSISVAPTPAPAPTPVRTVTPTWSINVGNLGNIPGVNAPLFS